MKDIVLCVTGTLIASAALVSPWFLVGAAAYLTLVCAARGYIDRHPTMGRY